MGYTTDFEGRLKLSRPATAAEVDFINKFSNSRRMRRNTDIVMANFKGKDGLPFVFTPTPAQAKAIKALEKSGLLVTVSPKESADTRTPLEIYGQQGEYYVGDKEDNSVLDSNNPSSTQPGLWCQWVLSKDGKELMWDGGEKFYNYVEWLEYMIKNFFEPWGIKLDGVITWSGEDRGDIGSIKVVKNKVTAKPAKPATIKY